MLAGFAFLATMRLLLASPSNPGTPGDTGKPSWDDIIADSATRELAVINVIQTVTGAVDAVSCLEKGGLTGSANSSSSVNSRSSEIEQTSGFCARLARLLPEYPLRVLPIREADPQVAALEKFTNSLGVYPEPIPAFTLDVRPREFTFSELLLNPSHDPQCFLPGLGLHLAVATHDFRLLERLLQMGEDPNVIQPIPSLLLPLFADKKISYYLSKDPGITPLMLATLSNQIGLVRLLLRYGAEKERVHTRKFQLYPLDFAAQRGDVPMMQLLLGRDSLSEDSSRRIVVSLSGQSAHLWQGGRAMLVSPVSTGKPGYGTPLGEYVVTQKYRMWRSSLYKVPMPNFMRLNCGAIGLHAGEVPDVPASHGCIRLPPATASLLFDIVQLGDRVSVIQ